MDRVNRRQTACLDTELEAVVNIRSLKAGDLWNTWL